MTKLYRVVDKNGDVLITGNTSGAGRKPAIYTKESTAQRVASSANGSGRSYNRPGFDRLKPYRVQYTETDWKELE